MGTMSGESFLLYLKEVQSVELVQTTLAKLINQEVDKEPKSLRTRGNYANGSMEVRIQIQDQRYRDDRTKRRYFTLILSYECVLPPARLNLPLRKLTFNVHKAIEIETEEEWLSLKDEDDSERCLQEALKILNQPRI